MSHHLRCHEVGSGPKGTWRRQGGQMGVACGRGCWTPPSSKYLMAPSPQDSFLVVLCTSVGPPEGGGASSTLPHLVTVWVLVLLTLGPVDFVLYQLLSVQACSLAVSEHWPSSHPTPACVSQGPGCPGQNSQQASRGGGMPHSASPRNFSPASACARTSSPVPWPPRSLG